jgi:hypothetical protein
MYNQSAIDPFAVVTALYPFTDEAQTALFEDPVRTAQ